MECINSVYQQCFQKNSKKTENISALGKPTVSKAGQIAQK